MNTILKLSSLYDDESWSIPGALTIDLRSLEGCCCYCDPEAEESIKAAISGAQTAGVHWIDTGDWVAACKDKLPLMRGSFRNTASLPRSLPVYLSIDLDVLSPQWARTDWSQGEMSLPELLQAIDAISKEHRVLGVDICGGLTVAKGARPADLSINVRTRMLLTDYLSSHPLVSG